MSLGLNKVDQANFLTELIPLLLSQGLTDFDLTILDGRIITFENLTDTFLIDKDNSDPNVIAKWRLDYPIEDDEKRPFLFYFLYSMYVHQLVNAHTSDFVLEWSDDDITYHAIFDDGISSSADNIYESDVGFGNEQMHILAQKLYIRLSGYISSLGVDTVEYSKIQFQMLMTTASKATLTQLI